MIGILRRSKNETIQHKTPFLNPFPFLNDSAPDAVTCKGTYRADQWCKVDGNTLCEIYGAVGHPTTESFAYQKAFQVEDRGSIPASARLRPLSKPVNVDPIRVFSIDSLGTQDVDDAFSTTPTEHGWRIGVHITDTTWLDPQWSSLAERRASSIYWEESTGRECRPMLPPFVTAQHSLLQDGVARPTISWWVEIDSKGTVQSQHFSREWVVNECASDYATHDKQGPNEALQAWTGHAESALQVAFAMVEYNKAFVSAMQSSPILYYTGHTYAKEEIQHPTLGAYTHATSPLRRFADFYNQRVFVGQQHEWNDWDFFCERVAQIRAFHTLHRAMHLAYACMDTPKQARIAPHPDPAYTYVWLGKDRYKVRTHESFYEPPREDAHVWLWGIHHRGRAVLRVTQEEIDSFHAREHCPPQPVTRDFPRLDAVCRLEDYVAHIESFCGYTLDAFQLECAQVVYEGKDLLAMAPTGSGKTVVALMGILAAFLRQSKAVYTSPIKALSNEKFIEFQRKMEGGRVSLLTGDIKYRSMPTGTPDPECLIMTAEILRAKLAQQEDLDTQFMSTLVQDEIHYISDRERGVVWEDTIVRTPPHVQIVSLSATIGHADQFVDWLSKRRPTRLVRHTVRSVPLHVGVLREGSFTRLYRTDEKRLDMTQYYSKKDKDPPVSYTQLVCTLQKDDKLPAILFCMSRRECVVAAQSFTKSIVIDPKPLRKPKKEQSDEEYADLLKVHSADVQAWESRFAALKRYYLGPFRTILHSLPGMSEWLDMLRKGVAYHHSGMIPVLREFVEILFREKLVLAVFATETLGVGINMPARTVVFTELEKPCGESGRRILQQNEFWQMAGRAGRRGMDTIGYVMYVPESPSQATFPTLFRGLLTGAESKATSRLDLTPHLVLSYLARSESEALMDKTLCGHEMEKQTTQLQRELEQHPKFAQYMANQEQVHKAMDAQRRLDDPVFRLTTKQRKQWLRMWQDAVEAAGGEETLSELQCVYRLEMDIKEQQTFFANRWAECVEWLVEHGFCERRENDIQVGVYGLACAQMKDKSAMVKIDCLCKGQLEGLAFEEWAAWLALLCPMSLRCPEEPWSEMTANWPSALTRLVLQTIEACEAQSIPTCVANAKLTYLWCCTGDIYTIMGCGIGIEELGTFIKLMLLVGSSLEEMRTILLGLERYAMYNTLDSHTERLYHGIVGPSSLYVSAKKE